MSTGDVEKYLSSLSPVQFKELSAAAGRALDTIDANPIRQPEPHYQPLVAGRYVNDTTKMPNTKNNKVRRRLAKEWKKMARRWAIDCVKLDCEAGDTNQHTEETSDVAR